MQIAGVFYPHGHFQSRSCARCGAKSNDAVLVNAEFGRQRRVAQQTISIVVAAAPVNHRDGTHHRLNIDGEIIKRLVVGGEGDSRRGGKREDGGNQRRALAVVKMHGGSAAAGADGG